MKLENINPEEILRNGKPVEWVEDGFDRDGWAEEHSENGYEYNGKIYVVKYDRDGWLDAIEVPAEYIKRFLKD